MIDVYINLFVMQLVSCVCMCVLCIVSSSVFLSITDVEATVALHLFPSLLTAPVIRRSIQGDSGRRKKTWKPTVAESMQSFVVFVPVVCLLYYLMIPLLN